MRLLQGLLLRLLRQLVLRLLLRQLLRLLVRQLQMQGLQLRLLLRLLVLRLPQRPLLRLARRLCCQLLAWHRALGGNTGSARLYTCKVLRQIGLSQMATDILVFSININISYNI